MLNIPIFWSIVKTIFGIHTYPTRTILYRVANKGLKRLKELTGYYYPIYYYCFRRWVANESNYKQQYTLYLFSYLLYFIANQSVFLQIISPNENKTGFLTTRVLLYLRSIIIIIISIIIFKILFFYNLYKSIFTKLPYK